MRRALPALLCLAAAATAAAPAAASASGRHLRHAEAAGGGGDMRAGEGVRRAPRRQVYEIDLCRIVDGWRAFPTRDPRGYFDTRRRCRRR